MSKILLNLLMAAEFFSAVTSKKTVGEEILLEFFSDNTFSIKALGINGHCAKISEYKFGDFFTKKQKVKIPDYVSLPLKFDELVGFANISKKYYHKIKLEFLVGDDGTCSDAKFIFSDSNDAPGSQKLTLGNTKYFGILHQKSIDDFYKQEAFAFDFTITPKIIRKISVCDENLLTIFLLNEGEDFNLVFSDSDYALIYKRELNVHVSQETFSTIDSRYLSFLRNETYQVSVSPSYIFFKGMKSGELTVIKCKDIII